MNRAVLTGPGRFRVDDAPVPQPGPGEALVRVRAVGICGSDMHLFKEGALGGLTIADGGANFAPGHECMGVVEEVGPDADRKLVGRRVFIEPAIACGKCRWCRAGKPNVCPHVRFLGLPPTCGALAQFITHPAHLCEPVPDEIDDDTAVLLEPLAIAVHALDRVAPQAGCSALVLGAGPIGLTQLMLLARAGMFPLIVTDLIDARLQVARELGATHTFNPKRDNVAQAVKDLTGGYGADFVFECAGVPDTARAMVELAAPAARVGLTGIPADDLTTFCNAPARRKGLDVLVIRRANLTFERAVQRTLHEKLPLKRLATHHWKLENVEAAFRTVAEYRDGVIKGMVVP